MSAKTQATFRESSWRTCAVREGFGQVHAGTARNEWLKIAKKRWQGFHVNSSQLLFKLLFFSQEAVRKKCKRRVIVVCLNDVKLCCVS